MILKLTENELDDAIDEIYFIIRNNRKVAAIAEIKDLFLLYQDDDVE